MSRIYVNGCGAVSAAGWGLSAFREALAKGTPLAAKELARPGKTTPGRARIVPPPATRPAFLAHPRVRRTSPIAQFTMAAGLEAIGANTEVVSNGSMRLGVIVCVMSACVNYSRRFYDEVLKEPSTASPLVFPETVFNAPASHIAAFLGTRAINYTLVGDPGTFLMGLATAADWLLNGRVDGCLVIGSEEADWLTAEAYALFQRAIIMGEGSGALFLQREAAGETSVELTAVTHPQLFTKTQTRQAAARRMKAELQTGFAERNSASGLERVLLCDSLQDVPAEDAAEGVAWNGWQGPRRSVKSIFGEGLMAAAAWQCVAAVDALKQGEAEETLVSVVGTNQQAIGAAFKVSSARDVTEEQARAGATRE